MNKKRYPLHHEDARPMYVSVPKEEYERMQAKWEKASRNNRNPLMPYTGWISVNERMPEDEDVDYLVWNGEDVYIACVTWFTDDDCKPYKEFFIDAPTSKKATHWMPLPEPPEGVKC